MEKIKSNNKVQELVRKFRQLYSYISCEASVLEKAATVTDFPEDVALDLMQDHILSQGLADEVVE